jgi:hypothetical protein
MPGLCSGNFQIAIRPLNFVQIVIRLLPIRPSRKKTANASPARKTSTRAPIPIPKSSRNRFGTVTCLRLCSGNLQVATFDIFYFASCCDG